MWRVGDTIPQPITWGSEGIGDMISLLLYLRGH
jgi:hypothetical protein